MTLLPTIGRNAVDRALDAAAETGWGYLELPGRQTLRTDRELAEALVETALRLLTRGTTTYCEQAPEGLPLTPHASRSVSHTTTRPKPYAVASPRTLGWLTSPWTPPTACRAANSTSPSSGIPCQAASTPAPSTWRAAACASFSPATATPAWSSHAPASRSSWIVTLPPSPSTSTSLPNSPTAGAPTRSSCPISAAQHTVSRPDDAAAAQRGNEAPSGRTGLVMRKNWSSGSSRSRGLFVPNEAMILPWPAGIGKPQVRGWVGVGLNGSRKAGFP